MLLDDVRVALDEQAARVPAGLVESDQVLTRARRAVRRRRIGRAAAAVVAAGLVIAGLVVVVAATGSTKRGRVVVSESTTTVRTQGGSAFTDEQLRAHLGAGVPAGWAPVDAGAARIFVPADWGLEGPGSCMGGPADTGVVSVGQLVDSRCSPGDQVRSPANAVSVLALSPTATTTGPAEQVVHGYRVYTSLERYDAAWTAYDVPQLGITLALRGNLQDQILATLAPSARAVAIEYAQHPAPDGHVVSGDGLRLTVPPNWIVSSPSGLPCNWPGASGPPELDRITPEVVVPSCAPTFPTSANAAVDGMNLYTSTDYAPQPSGDPVAVLHHRNATIKVYAEPNSDVLDIFVQRAGSTTTHALELALGRDGRVAGGVLASIEATS